MTAAAAQALRVVEHASPVTQSCQSPRTCNLTYRAGEQRQASAQHIITVSRSGILQHSLCSLLGEDTAAPPRARRRPPPSPLLQPRPMLPPPPWQWPSTERSCRPRGRGRTGLAVGGCAHGHARPARVRQLARGPGKRCIATRGEESQARWQRPRFASSRLLLAWRCVRRGEARGRAAPRARA